MHIFNSNSSYTIDNKLVREVIEMADVIAKIVEIVKGLIDQFTQK